MPNKVMGAKSCNTAGCHDMGISQTRAGSVIQGNEFQIWAQRDGHEEAYRVLGSPLASRIARNMGVGAPQEAQLCLTCHAVVRDAPMQGADYDITEGVNCEACHGPAGQWIDTHWDIQNVPEEVVRNQGLYPTHDPVKRAELCLDCHIGTTDTFAGHQLLAAGHPRTGFELQADSRLSAHYTIDEDYRERKPLPPEPIQWAMGQAVSVERRMELLISPRSGTIGFFPQLAFFECHSCHQPMSVRRRASVNRRGQPKLHDAHIRMMRISLLATEPGLAGRVESDRRGLHRAAGQGRSALVQAATVMRATARDALATMERPGFQTQDLGRLLDTLVSAGASGSYLDFASAEQLMKAVDWTIFAMREQGAATEERFRVLYELQTPVFEAVSTDDGYDAATFQRAMQAFQRGIATTN